MILGDDECWARLQHSRHGVLGTLHPRRGVDAVPVVFALVGGEIVLPVDNVKPKTSGRLQRLENLRSDPRCVLLADHYSDDWSKLWWVRVHGRATEAEPTEAMSAGLGDRHAAYRVPGAIRSVILFTPEEITGWAARG